MFSHLVFSIKYLADSLRSLGVSAFCGNVFYTPPFSESIKERKARHRASR